MSIIQNAKLPYQFVRGRTSERILKIQQANKSLFKSIMNNSDNLTSSRLEKLINNSFVSNYNHKINFKLNKLEGSNTIGGCEFPLMHNKKVIGYAIDIPFDKDKFKLKNLSILMHELTHLHHHLFEPKQVARAQILNITSEQENRLAKYYLNSLYCTNKLNFFNNISESIKLKSALRGLQDQEKLNILKYFKNNIRSEYIAYLEGEKYYNILSEKGIKQIESADIDSFLFGEKIEFINSEIMKLLKQMRKK